MPYIQRMRFLPVAFGFVAAVALLAACSETASVAASSAPRWERGPTANETPLGDGLRAHIDDGTRLIDVFIACSNGQLDVGFHLGRGDLTHNVIAKPETKKFVIGSHLRLWHKSPSFSALLERDVGRKHVYIARGISVDYFRTTEQSFEVQYSDGSFHRITFDDRLVDFADKCGHHAQ